MSAMFEPKPFDLEWEKMEDKIDSFKKNFKPNVKSFMKEYLTFAFMVFIVFFGLGIFGKNFTFKMIADSVFVAIVLGLIIAILNRFHVFDKYKKQKVEVIPPPKI